MIVVKLKGGLGNQLFQYAMGRSLAKIHRTVLKMDISFFDTYELHEYSIGPFNIQENFASAKEIRELSFGNKGVLNRVVGRLLHKSKVYAPTYVKEKMFQFDHETLNLPDGVYLDGYWQSEKYFADIVGTIRQEFIVKTLPVGKDKELGESMASCESVNLHIRRGSYLNPPYNKVHGTCSLDYYFRCIEQICKKVKNPHFFIFSDDPEWARNNLKLSYLTTLVDHNGADKDYEDLRLMTQCKYHILANSTFSWWGAWMSQRAEKMVFAPRQWFVKSGTNTEDLLPMGWKKM